MTYFRKVGTIYNVLQVKSTILDSFKGTVVWANEDSNNYNKGGFPLGEIFRPNRNFLLSYKHSDGTTETEIFWIWTIEISVRSKHFA
jgi:hypothetical protein